MRFDTFSMQLVHRYVFCKSIIDSLHNSAIGILCNSKTVLSSYYIVKLCAVRRRQIERNNGPSSAAAQLYSPWIRKLWMQMQLFDRPDMKSHNLYIYLSGYSSVSVDAERKTLCQKIYIMIVCLSVRVTHLLTKL